MADPHRPRRRDSQEAAQHLAQSPIAPDGHTWPGLQAGGTEAGVRPGERGPCLPSSTHRAAQAPLLGPPLLIATGESIPLLCLEGVPGLPGAPQDEAGLRRKFETSHV